MIDSHKNIKKVSSFTDPIIKQLRKSIPESEARLRQLKKEIIPEFIKPYHVRICELMEGNLEANIRFLKKMEAFKNEEMTSKFKKKKMNNLIGVSGGIKAGKDLVGQMIQYIGDEIAEPTFEGFQEFQVTFTFTLYTKYQIKKFADKLKDCLCLILGCTREQLEDRDYKNTELSEDWWYYKGNTGIYLYNTPYKSNKKLPLIKLTPRLLLQLLGTECGRNIIHPNIWCNSLFSDYTGDIETWKNIKSYEGLYQISSFGNVKSLDRKITYGNHKGEYHTRKGQLLKPTLSGGYATVSLSGITYTVHSLVARHFLKQPEGKDYVINHIDYNKENNFYKNLEWVKQADNVRYNYKVGKANIGEKQKDAKLTDTIVLQIKDWLFSGKYTNTEIARRVNVSPTTITDIKKGRKWKHVGKEIEEIQPILPEPTSNWIITDVRFPENEGKAVSDRGGLLIGVRRKFGLRFPEYAFREMPDDPYAIPSMLQNDDEKLFDTLTHESEVNMGDHSWCDVVIENNGTVEELFNEVLKAVYYKKELV